MGFRFGQNGLYFPEKAEMLALKGRYDGLAVVFDKKPQIPAGDVIVTFLDSPASERTGAFEKRDDDKLPGSEQNHRIT
jgi:hypothetical protein